MLHKNPSKGEHDGFPANVSFITDPFCFLGSRGKYPRLEEKHTYFSLDSFTTECVKTNLFIMHLVSKPIQTITEEDSLSDMTTAEKATKTSRAGNLPYALSSRKKCAEIFELQCTCH